MLQTHPEDDERLIALIEQVSAHAAGDGNRSAAQAALRELYQLTSRRLFGVALRVVGNREWAEDVLQETFLNVWRAAADYRSALSPPMAWLGLMARSRALDFLRRRASQRLDAAVEFDEALHDDGAGSADPLETHAASEQAWALHECLRKLETRQRELVSLAYFRDLSHGELSQQLRLPLGTVKTWMRRALEHLRGCMGQYAGPGA